MNPGYLKAVSEVQPLLLLELSLQLERSFT